MSTLEALYPHIAKRIVALWGRPELGPYLKSLLMDRFAAEAIDLHPLAFLEIAMLQRVHDGLAPLGRPRTLAHFHAPAFA